MDFNELAKQLAIFGAKIGTWSFGAAVVIEKAAINFGGEAWAFPEWEKVALAATIAGLVHFGFRMFGLLEKKPDA